MEKSQKNKKHIYLMPGMAASSRIFERLHLPDNYILHPLEWIEPHKRESLPDYAGRIAKEIKHNTPILLGVSFGAIIVQEIAQLIDYDRSVVISSVKSEHELPKKMLLARYTYLHRLLPVSIINHLSFWRRFAPTKALRKRIWLYQQYLGLHSKKYLRWGIDRIVKWKQKSPLPRTLHIHGDKDIVFPIKYIDAPMVVQGGTHIMVITRYRWLNEHLPKLLELTNG